MTTASNQELREIGERIRDLLDALATQRESEDRRSLASTPEETREFLAGLGDWFPEEPLTFNELKSEMIETARRCVDVRHPFTAAHLHCPPLADAVAADALVSALNPSMDSWDQSGAATVVESELIRRLGEECFAAHTTDGVFSSGGTQSNLMGLLLAREWAVKKWTRSSVFQDGLPEDHRRYRILCSENAHFSALKAAALLGLGARSLVKVGVDEAGRLAPDDLARAHAELLTHGERPFVVFATAGSTDHGAVDDLNAVADFCDANDLWMHVDAAYGGALLFSRQRDRLRGIERARSVTMDFHKLFFQPIACSAFLVRRAEDLSAITYNADYLNREDDVFPNLVDKSLATTRRFDAFKLFVSLRGLGRRKFAEYIDTLLELTRSAATLLAGREDFELLAEPQLTTVLFRLIDPHGQWSAEETDARNTSVREQLIRSGAAVVGESRVNGRTALKFTFMNPYCEVQDVVELIQWIARASAHDAEHMPVSNGG